MYIKRGIFIVSKVITVSVFCRRVREVIILVAVKGGPCSRSPLPETPYSILNAIRKLQLNPKWQELMETTLSTLSPFSLTNCEMKMFRYCFLLHIELFFHFNKKSDDVSSNFPFLEDAKASILA